LAAGVASRMADGPSIFVEYYYLQRYKSLFAKIHVSLVWGRCKSSPMPCDSLRQSIPVQPNEGKVNSQIEDRRSLATHKFKPSIRPRKGHVHFYKTRSPQQSGWTYPVFSAPEVPRQAVLQRPLQLLPPTIQQTMTTSELLSHNGHHRQSLTHTMTSLPSSAASTFQMAPQ